MILYVYIYIDSEN